MSILIVIRKEKNGYEGASLLPLIDIFDVGREDASLRVRASSSEENIVWVPIDGEHSGADGFLEQLGDPPVVLFIEGADSDRAAE